MIARPARWGRALPAALAACFLGCADTPERGIDAPGASQPAGRSEPAAPRRPVRSPATLAALEELGRATGCQVPATRPGGERGPDPWVLALPDRAGYVAWCEAEAGEAGPYGLLVVLASGRHAWTACPAYVPLHEYQPLPFFELTTLPDPKLGSIPLDQYWYVTADSWWNPEPVAAGRPPSGLAIHLHAGDAGNLILCHSGRWIMTGYH